MERWETMYSKKCQGCGWNVRLITQKDDCPEYYTKVSVCCPCGTYVVFELPVN